MSEMSSVDHKVKGQSDGAKERRRERNRLLAKRTRTKNKAESETLHKKIEALKNENLLLKQNIKDLGVAALALKDAVVLPATSKGGADPILLAVKEIITMMEQNSSGGTNENTYQRSFCISNAMVHGNPMLYQSQEYPQMKQHQAEQRQQQVIDGERYIMRLAEETAEVFYADIINFLYCMHGSLNFIVWTPLGTSVKEQHKGVGIFRLFCEFGSSL